MNKNISSEELLDELAERVKKNNVEVRIVYHYDEEKMVFRVKTETRTIDFYQSWDIKKSVRYRQNYEDYCLPLISEKQEREHNKKLEMFKIKTEK